LEILVFSEKKLKERLKIFWKRINRRSACTKCSSRLGALDLFPIFSYILLLAKCRKCKKRISPRYFLVEIFSGLVFLGLFWKFFEPLTSLNNNLSLSILSSSFWTEFIFFLPILCSLILIFLFDLKHKIIPDVVIFPTFLYSLFFINFNFSENLWDFNFLWDDIFRAFSFAIPFFAIWFFSRGRAMGFADWKLIFLLSLFFDEVMKNLLFVFGSFWVGAIYLIPLLILKKSNLKSKVPFGPFIIISFFLVYFLDLSYFTFLEKINQIFL
jgi:leader peptidase (prepilin peptidase)/N-methyltransferase